MNPYQVSRRVLCLCSSLGLGFGQCPTLALALRKPGLFLDLCLHSSPDLGFGLCRLPSFAQELCPGPSSRSDPVRCELFLCLVSTPGLDWSALTCLCQSSKPAPGVGLCLEPRHLSLCLCWSSSSGPEAGTAPCWPLGLEATHPSPPVLEAALLSVEPWNQALPHWPVHPMTSLSSWRLGNLSFLWKHSGGPRT